MTASSDKGSHIYGLGSVCTFPSLQSLQTEPAPACKQWFGTELTEITYGFECDVNACGYYRLPADSYAAIDLGDAQVGVKLYGLYQSPQSEIPRFFSARPAGDGACTPGRRPEERAKGRDTLGCAA